MSPQQFLRRFQLLIIVTWIFPPLFGFGLLFYIGMFTPAQIVAIMSKSPELIFIAVVFGFALWYFRRFARPICIFLQDRSPENTAAALRRIRRFPLDYWVILLGYLVIAPSMTIVNAILYAGFVPQPMDWFRIHLIALIVSIIIGLPIFFMLLDLFGQALRGIVLEKPHVTIKLKVFLIGALVPLLVDTMLVQYYWSRTGYFTFETFGIWLFLEVLAVVGSLIFVRSFDQSLRPLQSVIGLRTSFAEMDLSHLASQSTDELGVLTEDFRKLLEDFKIHKKMLEINNRILRFTGMSSNMEEVVSMILDACQSAVGGDMIFLLLHDVEQHDLAGVAQTGTAYDPAGNFRLPLDKPSMAGMIFNEGKTTAIADCRNDSRVSPGMIKRFNIRSALGAPLRANGRVIGVLMSVRREDVHEYSVQEIMLMESFAQEAALVVKARMLQDLSARAEQRYQRLNQLAPDAILLLDADLCVREVNAAAAGLLGEMPELLHGRYLAEFVVGKLDLLRRLAAGLDDGSHHFEASILRADGGRIPVQIHANRPMPDEPLIQAYVRDISVIQQSRDELHHLAHHDPLTKLPNRLLFHDRLSHALELARREGRQIAVLFVDLDRFKIVNDTLGHPIGDKLLQEVALRINGRLREQDTLARLGGDEFILLVEHLGDAQEASMVAQKLVDAFVQPFTVEVHELYLSCSVGISVFPMDGENATILVRNADMAMYRAKEQGRNNFQFYTQELTADAIERVALEAALRRALERGELLLHYQPQIDLKSGLLIGAEALIRWQHPELGLAFPERFIHLSEENGLIRPIGEWVLRNACEQMRAWRDQGFMLPCIAVNLSGHQLKKAGFVDQVRHVLRETRVEPGWLELEVTESFIMSRTDESIAMLDQLRDMGVQLAIDDFGTGYSSLSHLKRLPVQKLKIDRSFVQGVPQDSNDVAIARAVIALGKSMQLKVIAEGVETEQQQDFLRAEGCDEAQGYWYSRPVSGAEFLLTWGHRYS